MTAREIVATIEAALGADKDLAAWCSQVYKTDLAVTVGWSQDGEPQEGWSYPCCNLALWKSKAGESERFEELELNIEAAISDDCGDKEGVLRADDLMHLVRNAILRAKVWQDTTIETVGGMTELRPVYTARATIITKRLRSHRAGLGR